MRRFREHLVSANRKKRRPTRVWSDFARAKDLKFKFRKRTVKGSVVVRPSRKDGFRSYRRPVKRVFYDVYLKVPKRKKGVR